MPSIGVDKDTYMALLKIKGKLAEEKQKNISFGDVVAELLKAYKETEEGGIPPNKNMEVKNGK